MLVVRVITADVCDGIIGAQPRQGIDVGIRIVARQIAMVEPEEVVNAQPCGEFGLQFFLVQVRVAVGG